MYGLVVDILTIAEHEGNFTFHKVSPAGSGSHTREEEVRRVVGTFGANEINNVSTEDGVSVDRHQPVMQEAQVIIPNVSIQPSWTPNEMSCVINGAWNLAHGTVTGGSFSSAM